ncbi:MAG TPA: hypothetical protein VEK57_26145 [Thermoanaerobaculia bacterium]|nr:hypothetical protein [Thermoanaerobaculia bacterium]
MGQSDHDSGTTSELLISPWTFFLQDFNIPGDEAETLVDEVLIASIRHVPAMTDVEEWLTAAVTSAAKRRMEKP